MTLVPVHTPAGDAFLRADTAEAQGILPHARLSWSDWHEAALDDYRRNRAEQARRK